MDDSTASTPPLARTLARATVLGLAAMLACAPAVAGEANGIDALQAGLAGKVKQLARDGSRHAGAQRVEVNLGQLDSRLRLAPCQRIEPYLPAGTVLWGKARIGLRCTHGPTPWNVFLPVTVSVFGKAWVAAAPLSAGSVIMQSDLAQAEVDLAEDSIAAVTDAGLALGRTLARGLNTGQALRQTDLKQRQWFAAGDEVRVSARGSGFAVAGTGQALTHGVEGQPARVRVESGRVLVGMPVGERLMELPP